MDGALDVKLGQVGAVLSSPSEAVRLFLFYVEVGLQAGALLTFSVTWHTLSCLSRRKERKRKWRKRTAHSSSLTQSPSSHHYIKHLGQ